MPEAGGVDKRVAQRNSGPTSKGTFDCLHTAERPSAAADLARQILFVMVSGRKHVLMTMRWHVPSGVGSCAAQLARFPRVRQRAAAKSRTAGTLISSHLNPIFQHISLPMHPTAARYSSPASTATTRRCGVVQRLRAAYWATPPSLL